MLRILILVTIAVAVAACSSSSPVAPTATTPPPPPPASSGSAGPPTISITANGMSPLELTIAIGQRVTIVNNDSRPHDVVGGKDPATPDCPEIIEAGFLQPGQSSQTGVFTQAKTCEYHDHTMLSVPAFQGRIFIR
jgi:plastocyanin